MPDPPRERRPSRGPAPDASPSCVLIVDDDPDTLHSLAQCLRTFLPGARVLTASSAEEAIVVAGEELPDAVVADYLLQGTTGAELIAAIRHEGLARTAILVSGFPAPRVRQAAAACGAEALLEKPYRIEALLGLLRRAASPLARAG